MSPLASYGQPMMDEPEPAGYEHGPMGEMGEAPHYGEVIPFPLAPPEPESVTKLKQQAMLLMKLAKMPNVADAVTDEELGKLGSIVVREFRIDEDSRADWEKSARRAMDIARQKVESKSYPWDGASNVKFPMLTTAALQFAARAYPAIVDGPRIVKCQVMGRDPAGLKAAMADRVSQHMSYQLLYEIPHWESDMDTALHQIPIVGCAFKKVYPDDASEAGVTSDLASAFDVVVNQGAKSLSRVPRITHVFKLYPHEIEERIREGKFREIELTTGSDDSTDSDSPHTFLEQHRYWDVDSDGVKEPWVVTVHKETQKVVRIKPCFDVDKIVVDQERGKILRIPRRDYWVKIPFIPDPEGGFYDIGFGKLLEAISDVIDTTINQMMDAGTLQNSGGGFAASGLQLGKSTLKMKPGQYPTVPGTGDDIRKALVHLEHPGPAPVLMQLLEFLINAGKDIASVKDILTGETPTNQTATSTMAAIEQGLKVFTAIYKRIFRALKEEYRLIFDINKETLNQAKYVALLDEPIEVVAQDYHDDIDVLPVADPNTVTEMQRMAKAQFVMEQVEKGNPFIDGLAATKRALEAARIEKPEELLKPPPPGPPPEAEVALQDGIAGVELKRAQAAKTAIEGVVAAATSGMAVPIPLQPELLVTQSGPPMGQPPPPGPMGPQGMPPQGIGGIGGMGGPPPFDPMMEGGGAAIPPDDMALMAQQLGGNMGPRPEAAPVPPGLEGLQ